MRPSSRLLVALTLASLAPLAGCDDSGSPAQPPPQGTALTRRNGLDAGDAHCPHGGWLIESGPDTNANGQLEDGEVVTTEWDCFPAPPPTLVRNDAEPPGEHCAEGGTAVRAGADLDGDGVLDDAEVTQTSYVCNATQVWEGDFTAADWSDPAKVAALEQARVVTGALTIARDGQVTLPELEAVVGDLELAGGMNQVDLPGLKSVGGHLLVDASGMSTLTLPSLQRVNDWLEVRIVASGASVAMPALTDVGGVLEFFWGARGTMDLRGLRRSGPLVIDGSLDLLELDSLETINGDLGYDDLALAAIELPSLKTLTGKLTSISDTVLTTIDMPLVETMGEIELLESHVSTLSMPSLRTVAGGVTLSGLANLTTLELGALEEVDAGFQIMDAPALHTLALPALRTLHPKVAGEYERWSLFLYNVGIEELALPSLRSTDGELFGRMCASLRTVRLDVLETAEWLDFVDNPVQTSVSAPVLTDLDRLFVMGTPLMTTLDYPKLERVRDYMDVRDVAITDFSGVPRLRVIGELHMSNLPQLRDLGGAAIERVGTLDLYSCTALTSLHGLEGVHDVPGIISVELALALTSLAGLENVVSVGNRLMIDYAPGLTDLDGLARLRTVGAGGLMFGELPGVTSLAPLAALESVDGQVQLGGLSNVPAAEITELRQRLHR